MNELEQTKELLSFTFAFQKGEITRAAVKVLKYAFGLARISEDWAWYFKVRNDIIRKSKIMTISPIEQEQYFDSYMRRMRMK